VSFVEQNQRWLLPVLGAAVAGVVWLNLPGHPAPPRNPPEAEWAEPAGPDAKDTGFGADLKALAAPPPSANVPAPLLRAGLQPLDPGLRRPPAPPRLHPAQWPELFEPAPAPAPRSAAPAAAGPPPTVEFTIATGTRSEAWVQGRGYAPGAALAGGYTLKRITGTGVVLSGPRGELELPLGSRPAKSHGVRP
jgi:hypothetical protein